MVVYADRIFVEITRDDAVLSDEYGDSLLCEDGVEIMLEQPGFVDVWPDVVKSRDIEFSYGIFGNTMHDRVAGIGSMSFRLNNGDTNSAGLAGYYSPDHVNFCGGFDRETMVKLTIESGGIRRVKWRGIVRDIVPEMGLYGLRHTDVECDDMMSLLDDMADVNLLGLQENVTSDYLYAYIADRVSRKFPSTSFSPNSNTLTFGFDTAIRKRSTARNEMNKIAISTMDYVFSAGDTYEGGRLTSQTYADRFTNLVNEFVLDGDFIRTMEISRSDKIDRCVAVVYPREIGVSDEILYSASVSAGKAQSIAAGETMEFTVDYRDPNQTATRIAALSITPPVAGTDYKLGTGNGDNSQNLNGSSVVVVEPGATSARVRITNSSGSVMYMNQFRLQGIAIRQFDPIEIPVEVDNPIGDIELRLDLSYEDDAIAGRNIAELGKQINDVQFTRINAVSYLANIDAEHWTYFLEVEPGTRGVVSEPQTGVTQPGFVNAIAGRIHGNGLIDVTYTIERSSSNENFWLLGVDGRSELEDTTYVSGV